MPLLVAWFSGEGTYAQTLPGLRAPRPHSSRALPAFGAEAAPWEPHVMSHRNPWGSWEQPLAGALLWYLGTQCLPGPTAVFSNFLLWLDNAPH